MELDEIKVVKSDVDPNTLELRIIDKSVGFLDTNIENLEIIVKERLKDYSPENYCGDADLAKKDRAELNKAKESIKKARIAIIKELMKPYSDFEARCKKLEKEIDTASGLLDEIVKVKEQEEKDLKSKKISLIWENKGCKVVPLEKVFNPKWLNKTYKISEIESDIDAIIKKIYADLKTIERFADDAEMLKAHYLMELDIEETFSYADELQRQKEIAEKEKVERQEREHNEQVEKQKDALFVEESQFGKTQELQNLSEQAIYGDAPIPSKERKEFVITVKCFDEELLNLKGEMNKLGIEFSVEPLEF